MNRRAFLAPTGLVAATAAASKAEAATNPVQRQIKIAGISTDHLIFPPSKRRNYDAIHEFGDDSGAVVLRVNCDTGITGSGYNSFGMVRACPSTVRNILEKKCAPVLVGRDPAFAREIRTSCIERFRV